MAVRKNRTLYQFKVTLRDIDPSIWRRIQVWEDMTLSRLHRALQIVMGWEDYHVHEFHIGRKRYGIPDLDDHYNVIDVRRTRIQTVVQRVGTEFEYVYDLGDNWHHRQLLEAVLLPAPDGSYPRCIAGERSGPPEDVGGSAEYENYLAALADPEHKEHEDMLAWRGPFAPEAFSLVTINQRLQTNFPHAQARTVPSTTIPPKPANDGGTNGPSLVR